jgi:hypothetical protein
MRPRFHNLSRRIASAGGLAGWSRVFDPSDVCTPQEVARRMAWARGEPPACPRSPTSLEVIGRLLAGGAYLSAVRRTDVRESQTPRILRNRCRCRRCGDVIESLSVHHYVRCVCGAIFTDGGREYAHRGGGDDIEDLSEVES